MKKIYQGNYICYDGYTNDITLHKTKKEAFERLKHNIECTKDKNKEWVENVKNSFTAKLIHIVECHKIS